MESSRKSVRRVLVAVVSLAVVTTISFSAESKTVRVKRTPVVTKRIKKVKPAIPRPVRRRPAPSIGNPYDNTFDTKQTVKEDIFEQFRGEQTLKVKARLGLNRRFNGRKVVRVVMQADSARGGGMAQLLINGRAVGERVRLRRDLTKAVFKLPRHQQVLGSEIRTLQIRLRGNIFVETLKAVLKGDDNGGNNRRVDVNVGRTISNYDKRVSLRSLLGRTRIDNRPIRRIEIFADSHDYNSQIRVCNSRLRQCTTHNVDSYSSRPIVVSVRGDRVGDLELQTNREVYISRMVITFQ